MSIAAADHQTDSLGKASGEKAQQGTLLRTAIARHAAHQQTSFAADFDHNKEALLKISGETIALQAPLSLFEAWATYWRVAGERMILTLDALRKRGDIFLAQEAAGAPPVLTYDYEILVDGQDLPRPCNYMLLHIKPPDTGEILTWKRPYMIIDPRAGHGPGIGGFKPDSQVGVALKDGHPVYVAAFRPMPEPGQTIADVTLAEAAFLRAIQARHPEAPKPVIVGNCQGGWATAILAATNADLVGPIVLNGAPMAYWSGRLGQDPMRYTGGSVGGITPALISADGGGGLFDGADLVLNFEMLNPGRTWFRKYDDLYTHIDRDEARFLEFERWWGGFFLMSREEIRWINENLFIGNKLSRNEARLDAGTLIDLKAIRAPIIVFASHGDNITPPQQALNWIIDSYTDEREIEIRGQRILYMIHDEVGHLGIFVSSSVARREHAEMASTLKTIDALPPGLYEMMIEDIEGDGHQRSFQVSFHKRRIKDLAALDDQRAEEAAFAALARVSENMAELYRATLSPWIKAMSPPALAAARRQFHPLRLQRSLLASPNPMMAMIEPLAESVLDNRHPLTSGNPFHLAERFGADLIEQAWNAMRDLRDAAMEASFLMLCGNPLALWYDEPKAARRATEQLEDLQALPEVQAALGRIEQGGLAEAIVRVLVLLAATREDVRRDRLERSFEVLSTRRPFAEIEQPARARMIHEQTMVAHFKPEAALNTLLKLLATKPARREAMAIVDYVIGKRDEMEPTTARQIDAMRALLDLRPDTTQPSSSKHNGVQR